MSGQTRTRDEWIEILRVIGQRHLSNDDPAQAYDEAYTNLNKLLELGLCQDGDMVVDVGSGTGRFAIPLTERNVTYLGLEPMRECVEPCREAFAPWPNIRFLHLDVRNDVYNREGALEPDQVRLPVESASADNVIFASVFTHLGTIETCRHYLAEAWRILRPGKYCLCSWFPSPPHELCASPARTVLKHSDIIEAIRPWTCVATLGGVTDAYHDQWYMLLRKPGARPA